ncbi:hypothetical protein EX30DRAFT_372573 [Ascodesmis nigricans]|uniref:Uncharacterized protein n=1 Tax=Ascodesmis nigricans TaxID=341454 RepID=A0A4S2MU94_9PEZI|nr:hypothetical protein EX30DRAFT_372573 [Ascodesmis nigricans]
MDLAFGNRVLGFVENQLDNIISLFSAEPGGSGPELTKPQVTQLATKVNRLSEVLEQCDSGFRRPPISRPGSRQQGTRSVSVHFENKISITGMDVLEKVKEELQNMGSANEQFDATSQCNPPASTSVHSVLRRATINIVGEAPSSNKDDSSPDPENSNLRLSRTWPIDNRSRREQSTTGDEVDSDDSDFQDDKTSEPLLPHHVPLEEQLMYFRELDIICMNAAYDFYHRYKSELSIVPDRRNQLVVKINIDGPHCQTLPQWTNLLRSLATAKGIKPDMVAQHTSFNGETQSVDEVRHALSKRKDKSDRDMLALVQMARTFCWQLKDWKRCKELDVMYTRLERVIAAANKEKREVKKAAMRQEARLRKLKEAEPGHRLKRANTFDMCANQKRLMDLDTCSWA